MIRTLAFPAHNFDQTASFRVHTDRRLLTATLQRDYDKIGDGVLWALNTGSTLKSSYTKADQQEAERLCSEGPIRDGDEVVIEGDRYRVRVLGPYSDCAIFDPIEVAE